jgi:hypothetical protein
VATCADQRPFFVGVWVQSPQYCRIHWSIPSWLRPEAFQSGKFPQDVCLILDGKTDIKIFNFSIGGTPNFAQKLGTLAAAMVFIIAHPFE